MGDVKRVTREDLMQAVATRRKGIPVQPIKFPEGFRDRGTLAKEKTRELLASLSR